MKHAKPLVRREPGVRFRTALVRPHEYAARKGERRASMSNERIPPKRRSRARADAPKEAGTGSGNPRGDHPQAEKQVILGEGEGARREAEEFRRVAEVTREASEQDRKTAEVFREEREQLREAAETARTASEEARLAAEGARHAVVESVNATAESLKATLEQMSVVEEMRRLLRDIRDTKKLEPN